MSNEDPVRGCPAGPELKTEFTMRPYIGVQSDHITITPALTSEGESIISNLLGGHTVCSWHLFSIGCLPPTTEFGIITF